MVFDIEMIKRVYAGLPAKIDDARKKLGLSIRQLSSEINVSAATLSRIEDGNKPDIDTFMRICNKFGWVNIKNLFLPLAP